MSLNTGKNFIMKTKRIISFFLLIILFVSCKQEQSREYHLSGEKDIIEITNNGQEKAVFRISTNGNEFYSEEKIVSFIKNMDEEYPDEPMEMKAFRFVRDYTWHDDLVTRHTWAYSPYIMVNSFGGGLCGFRSATLTNILIKLGFEARSWCLEGHVVTEVYTDNKWKLMDVDYGVYYFNSEGEIASYEELCNNPTLITNPQKKILKEEDYYYVKVYSGQLANLYSTTADNVEFDVRYNRSLENEELYFELPSGASMTFPFNKKYTGNFYAFAELDIPSGYTGKINIPLVIAGMTGTGVVKYNETNFKVNHFDPVTVINKQNEISFQLEIIDNPNGIRFFYYINPLLYKTEKDTKFKLSGKNLDDIDVNYSDRELKLFLSNEEGYLNARLDSLLSDFFTDYNTVELKFDKDYLSDYFDRVTKILSDDDELSSAFDLNGFRSDLDSIANVFQADSLTDYSMYFQKDIAISSISKLLNNRNLNPDLF